MSAQSKYRLAAWFVGGFVAGALVLAGVMTAAGWKLVDTGQAARQQAERAELERVNRQLSDRLFALQSPAAPTRKPGDLPYEEGVDARAMVRAARAEAIQEGRFLMVTFGANWCMDCRTLYRVLKTPEVADYTRDLFSFVQVDVGKFNRNRELARELGVDLSRGIPVAVFFDPEGRVVGTTNQGQLEPARRYSSKQILRFLRDVAERERVLAPDSVGF